MSRSAARAGPQLAVDDLVCRDWSGFVNAPMSEAEAEAIRVCIRRDRPYGGEAWTHGVPLGLESSHRPRGGQRRGEAEAARIA